VENQVQVINVDFALLYKVKLPTLYYHHVNVMVQSNIFIYNALKLGLIQGFLENKKETLFSIIGKI
jgi:hypothetical protein